MGCDKLKMVIFKLLFLSYMHTTFYFYSYHANSIAMLYIVHKYKKRFESTNMDLTHSLNLVFISLSSKGVCFSTIHKSVQFTTSCKLRTGIGHT